MRGHILLAGGAEFSGRMAEVDQRAFALAGGYASPLAIIPAAAAPDNNHLRAGANGVRWFTGLGGLKVQVLPVIDPISAVDPKNAGALMGAKFIYLLGGFPGHQWQTLHSSPAWEAILQAYHQGAVVGGSSAGAMVLCVHGASLVLEQLRYTARVRCVSTGEERLLNWIEIVSIMPNGY